MIKLLLMEVFGTALPLYILYEGLAKTSALTASLIGATGPIFVVLGGIWFLHERETKREWQGLVFSLIGSLVLVIAPTIQTGVYSPTFTLGNLYILGYNILYAVYAILAKKFYKQNPPLYFGSLVYLITALIYYLILRFTHSLPSYALLTTSQVLLPVLYMAIPGGLLAFTLYLIASSRIEVSEANLFTYLNGVIAIPTAYLLLGETPSFISLIAIIIIAFGVYRAEKKSA